MKLDPDKSIFEYKVHPVSQGVAVLAVILASIGFASLLKTLGWYEPSVNMPWIITFSFLLFYALGNCLMSFSADKPDVYWVQSVFIYVLIAGIGVLVSSWISGISILESKSFRWILMIFSFSYLVLLTIMRMIRRIIKYVIKQDKRMRGELEDE